MINYIHKRHGHTTFDSRTSVSKYQYNYLIWFVVIEGKKKLSNVVFDETSR